MKTNSHTPGPWKVSSEPAQNGRSQIIQESTAHIGNIAEVWGRSNARLIASAPDLLRACKLALVGMEAVKVHGLEYPIETVKAAIQKAEGGV